MVVSPKALRIEWGMNDESLTFLGIFPSLHERMSRWLKSRLRVSSTPITCTPTAGSPWKGIAVDAKSCCTRRCRVMMSNWMSPSPTSANKRLSRVYTLKNASVWRMLGVGCWVLLVCFRSWVLGVGYSCGAPSSPSDALAATLLMAATTHRSVSAGVASLSTMRKPSGR